MTTDAQINEVIKYITKGDYIAIFLNNETHPIEWLEEMNIKHNYDSNNVIGRGGYVVMIEYNERFSFVLISGEAEMEDIRYKLIKHSRYRRVLDYGRESDKELIENILYPIYEWSDKTENAFVVFENIRDTHDMAKMGMSFSAEFLETKIKFCVENELFRESVALEKLIHNS